jgi:ribosomal protein S18 acetylase RimI-like enzyme
MIKVKYEEKQQVVDILTKAFDTNKSVNHAVKQDKHRVRRIRKLMDYSFEKCWDSGEIYMTQDKKGVALFLLPHKSKTSIKSIWLDVTLIVYSIGVSRVFKILKKESIIKKHHPEELMYLWYIGIEPENQGKGIGSSMLKGSIELAKQRGLPIYLETSTEKNIPLYKRFNFQEYKTIDLDYRIYLFKYDVR